MGLKAVLRIAYSNQKAFKSNRYGRGSEDLRLCVRSLMNYPLKALVFFTSGLKINKRIRSVVTWRIHILEQCMFTYFVFLCFRN